MKLLIIALLLIVNQGHSQPASAAFENDHLPYRIAEVDQRPKLPDGLISLSLFMRDNFKMPDIKNKKIKLFVSFTIEKDGTMTDFKSVHLSAANLVEKNVHQDEEDERYERVQLDAMKLEALRVLALFNIRWNPAHINEQPVRCLYNYPISFNLE